MSFCLRPNVCKKCGKPLTMFEGWICLECEKAEQEPCDDAISRQYLLDNCIVDKVTMPYVPVNKIKEAPPVKPQEPKTGHWIVWDTSSYDWTYKCDKCGSIEFKQSNYCPNCGCHMVESQESEVNNG